MTAASDPIEFELFKNALFSIADEMALTILRTAYSGLSQSMSPSGVLFIFLRASSLLLPTSLRVLLVLKTMSTPGGRSCLYTAIPLM